MKYKRLKILKNDKTIQKGIYLVPKDQTKTNTSSVNFIFTMTKFKMI